MISLRFQRGLEQALEKVVGGDFALVGDDRRAERQRGGGIVGGGIVVGDRAADRAAIADGGIADQMRQRRERRDRSLHDRAVGDVGVARHGADHYRFAFATDASEFGDPAEIDDRGGSGEPLLHRGDERLTAGQQLGVLVRESGERVLNVGGVVVGECIHGIISERVWERAPSGAADASLFSGALHDRLLGGAPDDLRRGGHGDVFMADRVGDRVDHGRRRGDRAGFAAALKPSGFVVQGVETVSILNEQKSAARGMQ